MAWATTEDIPDTMKNDYKCKKAQQQRLPTVHSGAEFQTNLTDKLLGDPTCLHA